MMARNSFTQAANAAARISGGPLCFRVGSDALQAKLDELIWASSGHRDLIGIENLTEEEISHIKARRARTG